jgi:hypothetical protein
LTCKRAKMGVSTDDDGQLLILMPAHNVVAVLAWNGGKFCLGNGPNGLPYSERVVAPKN